MIRIGRSYCNPPDRLCNLAYADGGILRCQRLLAARFFSPRSFAGLGYHTARTGYRPRLFPGWLPVTFALGLDRTPLLNRSVWFAA